MRLILYRGLDSCVNAHYTAGKRAWNFKKLIHAGLIASVGSFLLCIPAIYNGYPLIFPDLLDYGEDGMAIVRKTWPGGAHPPLYGVVIWPLHLETSLWPIVFAQGLVLSHLIFTVLRKIDAIPGITGMLALLGGLAVFTPLSWYTSFVMPDVFVGVLILSLFLLEFCRQRLSALEKIYFIGLVAFCVNIHLSHFPIAVAILGATFLLRALAGSRKGAARPGLGLASVMLALCVSLTISWKLWGGITQVPNAAPILLARVLVDGPGKDYLNAECGHERFVLCGYLNKLHGSEEDFLYMPNSPLYVSGRMKQIKAEAMPIVLGSFEMFPLRTIRDAIRQWVLQGASFLMEAPPIESIPDAERKGLLRRFKKSLPFAWRGYQGTRQQEGELETQDLVLFNRLQQGVVLASAAVLAWLLRGFMRSGNLRMVQFIVVLTTGVLANAFVTGVFSGVFDRYQGRVIWLVPFGALAAGLSAWQARHREPRPCAAPGRPREQAAAAASAAPAAVKVRSD